MTAAAVVALHLVQYSEVGIVLDPKRMTVDGSQTQIYVGNMLARCQSKWSFQWLPNASFIFPDMLHVWYIYHTFMINV